MLDNSKENMQAEEARVTANRPAVTAEEIMIDKRRQKRRRRLRWIIFICLFFLGLLTFLETRVFGLGELELPISGNLLIFIMINISVLLLITIIFLVLRNLVELIFERRRRILGANLRTKLVISFISLSLIPTGLLFLVSLKFISTSMDYWFNVNVERSLAESLELARDIYRETEAETSKQGEAIAAQLQSGRQGLTMVADLEPLLTNILASHGLSGIEIVGEDHNSLLAIYQPTLAGNLPELPEKMLSLALAGESGRQQVVTQEVAAGELVRSLSPLTLTLQNGQSVALVLVLSQLIPTELLERMTIISSGLEDYRQLMVFQSPIRTSLLITLLIITLLIVFGAIWFGFYVAAGLTGPIRKLAEATRRVTEGELDFILEKTSNDEMGTLVDSFNRMTKDLLNSRHQINQTTTELDKRRRYTETILQNVAAGVISFDDSGRVITINRFAEDLLKVDRKEIVGRHYRAILRPNHLRVLESFLRELAESGKHSIQRPLRLTIGAETFSLQVNFTLLRNEEGLVLGVVLVFANLSELEKAQRMAAWREVARRIAHEIKNPLTPIQLSAQRLRKKYLKRLAAEDEVFDLCTQTIISQVDEIQKLVSEFSSFARLPTIHRSLNKLLTIVDEVLVLYREGHNEIRFSRTGGEQIPPFMFDPKQIKRILINLLDNAVGAVEGTDGGEIVVVLIYDRKQELAILEIRDNGPGVKDEDKSRLFEPYFSTKKSGTGLGLAIAATIVADHKGSIRIHDNKPRGACFVVELPLKNEGMNDETGFV